MTKLKGKVIWLTGASSGIGEALSYALADKGAKLILSARRKNELERVKGNCSATSQKNIVVLPLDLSKPTTLQLCTEAAIQAFGWVDIVIHNAGIGQRSFVKETQMSVDRAIMEIDYFGPVALTRFLLPHFIDRKIGQIVVVSSVMGKFGTPQRSGYAAAKHALHGFFDSLRAELWKERKKITVTLICPGWVRSNFSLHSLNGDGNELSQSGTPGAKGMSTEIFARKMIRAVERKKTEVYIGGWREVNAVRLKRLLPGLFARIIRNASIR